MEIVNKRVGRDYELFEKLEAGMNLNGSEVRAIKLGHADLTGSFVKILGSEAYLVNSKIYADKGAVEEYDPRRTRKLLMHKKEILALKGRIAGSSLTIVPILMYTTDTGLIKLQIALAKGLRKFDKRRPKR